MDLQKLNGAVSACSLFQPWELESGEEGWVGSQHPQAAATCLVRSPVISPPAQFCQRSVIQQVTKDTQISFPQPLWFQVKQPLTNEKA